MEKKLVPTHKYKTSIVFIDDNLEFLNMLKNNLNIKNVDSIFVDNVLDFQNLLTQSNDISKNLPNVLVKLDNELTDLDQHESFDFDLTNFDKIRNNSQKNQEIGLVFIDKALPDVDGLDLSKSLNSGIKKVLLTGECGLAEAVDAFNNNIIDMFIDKIDNHIIDKISKSVEHFIDSYFINKDFYNNSKLSSPTFKKIFDTLIKEYSIIEYYLIEKDTFLFINEFGKHKLFKCWDQIDFNDYYNKYFDEFDSNKDLDLIRLYNKIPVKSQLKDTINDGDFHYCVVDIDSTQY